MTFQASIDIMPHKELLDPQGKTVEKNMKHIDVDSIENVRIGKHVEFKVNAQSEDEAKSIVENICTKMLVNAIMETYNYTLTKVE